MVAWHLENVLLARGRVAPGRHHAALQYSEIGAFCQTLRLQAGIGPALSVRVAPSDLLVWQNLSTAPQTLITMGQQRLRVP